MRLLAELRLVQVGVQAVFRDKFMMYTPLDDSTAVQHQNLIGGEYGAEPVRDDNISASGHDAAQGVLY